MTNTSLDRDEAIGLIRKALRERSGLAWSVSGGRGTAWGWIRISAPPARLGALKERSLVRLVLENDRVTGEEHLLADRGRRIRDVRQGPDGALYVVTDESRGELWRIAPRR